MEFAVVVDGLNEVGRYRAMQAFADDFPQTKILVTSVDAADRRFHNWVLPRNVHEYVESLLDLYLLQPLATEVMLRITQIGLMEFIRSGYDVRLIVDLVKDNNNNTNSLPKN